MGLQTTLALLALALATGLKRPPRQTLLPLWAMSGPASGHHHHHREPGGRKKGCFWVGGKHISSKKWDFGLNPDPQAWFYKNLLTSFA